MTLSRRHFIQSTAIAAATAAPLGFPSIVRAADASAAKAALRRQGILAKRVQAVRSAPGKARSAPSAAPDRAHTATKAAMSPAPSVTTLANTAIDSNMPASQVRASPQCATALSHSGIDSAAQTK